MFPAVLCLVIVLIQAAIDNQLDNPKHHCGCKCIDTDGKGRCQNVCGIEYSTAMQASSCPIPTPQQWPALLQVPAPQYRAVQTASHPFTGLPHSSCMNEQSCPVTSLFTGMNRTVADGVIERVLQDAYEAADLSHLVSLSNLGTQSKPDFTNYVEPGYTSKSPVHVLLPRCLLKSNSTVSVKLGTATFKHVIDCVESLYLWRENSSMINREIFHGYQKGNSALKINEILSAYDFSNSSNSNFNVIIWYNSSYSNVAIKPRVLRVPQSLNIVSNAFLRHFKDENIQVLLDFVKEMPKAGHINALTLSSIGPLLFAWVIQMLFPVFLTSLVYEKQHKLRIMMKMHGLGDGPYWLISYVYFLFISSIYMFWFFLLGSAIGLEIFQRNSYSVQLLFFFVYINLQITFAFLAASVFSDARTASVVGYIYVFGSGLLGAFLFEHYIEDTTFSRRSLIAMELVPGFSLYQGLYELSHYAVDARYDSTSGLNWSSLNDRYNGMKGTLAVMTFEWIMLLFVAHYLDQVVFSGTGIGFRQHTFFKKFQKRNKKLLPKSSSRKSSSVFIDMEKYNIVKESHRVENLLKKPTISHPLVCYKLKKVFKGKGLSSKTHAVQSLSLAVPQGECFGLLGPNGSGKTTIIKMVTGFLSPTSGIVLIAGTDFRANISTRVGICPQQDLIWEDLTGTEHLLFYGRLRNLRGKRLKHEVDECLKRLDLYEGNVGDQLAGKYSGGMKRRLSVAISLIGDTQIVFMDEPTTGLDPESRNNLWKVIKQARENRAIILTTHSMQEAEFLCDRIGIIVDGNLQCLGSSRELKRIYGGSYLLTISTNPADAQKVEDMVRDLSWNAVKISDVGGTQKFRLPKEELRIADIFLAVEKFRREINIVAFGLTDASLEDVFIKVVHGTAIAGSKNFSCACKT
ncbi:ABC transporter A family member 7-like [Aristolochia californica]|uniref:ABC transporter A family member 7-like n=1 Tax=Aristolochia californica TaxID=171875 RepID=UPI0035E05336